MVFPVELVSLKPTLEYSFGRYQFRVNIWYLIIFLIVQTLLNELGFWQLNRAKEKQYRISQLEKGSQSVVSDLNQIGEKEIAQFQNVTLTVELEREQFFLLDSKIHNKKPGYHVLNLVKDPVTDKVLIVNRGWVFAGKDRNQLPSIDLPPLNWNIEARVYPIAKDAITTALAKIEKTEGHLRLPQLDLGILKQLEERLNFKIEPYILRLNKDSQGALVTNWIWTNMSPEKHLAYAIQWFSLALAFLIVSLIASFRKR